MNDPAGLEGEPVGKEDEPAQEKEAWWEFLVPPLWWGPGDLRYERAAKPLKRSLVKFGTGFVEAHQKWPSVTGEILRVLPGYKEQTPSDKWNKNGTHKSCVRQVQQIDFRGMWS